MKVHKFEAVGIAVSIGAMAVALWLLQMDTNTTISTTVPETDQAAAIIVAEGEDTEAALREAIESSTNSSGEIDKLIIDDVVFGSGPEVVEGDTVEVHYVGALQNGQRFDSSYERGTPFTFTVGQGRVIAGWERGLLGMQVGGQRVLVIPSEFAYGENGAGPIPPNATLVFTIELLAIN